MRSFCIIHVSMKLWNKLSNDVKVISFVPFKVYATNMYMIMYIMQLY